MKYIFFDESESADWFVLAGILVEQRKILIDAIKYTKKYVKNKRGLPQKVRIQLLNELKEHLLYKHKCHSIKEVFLKRIAEFKPDVKVFCCCYKKNISEKFDEVRKREVYRNCIAKIFDQLDGEENKIIAIYDEIGDKDFQEGLSKEITENFEFIAAIESAKSTLKELQCADIFAGCIRRSLNKEDLESIKITKDLLKIEKINVSFLKDISRN